MASAHDAPDSVQARAIETQLRDALRLDPAIADAHLRLAELYSANRDMPSAIAEYRCALDHNPELAEAHYRLSQLYARTGQPELAREQLELHRQLRARQKKDIESGVIPLRFPNANSTSCRVLGINGTGNRVKHVTCFTVTAILQPVWNLCLTAGIGYPLFATEQPNYA
jgi:tetratricopeptide (TPR) repeat protein